MVLPTDTSPSTDNDRARFAAALGGCLALVAPTGMAQTERRVWMEAAFSALRHLPIDAIEKAAERARLTADHPSKIVPCVIAAAEPDMAWRRRQAAPHPASETALPAPGGERPTNNEVEAICRRFAVGRFSSHDVGGDPSEPARAGSIRDEKRPSRVPTREDYIRMGVSPAVLDAGGVVS